MQMVQVTWPKWQPCPYMIKSLTITIEKYLRSSFTIDIPAKVAHVGLPSVHLSRQRTNLTQIWYGELTEGLGHILKMATMSILGQSLKNHLLQDQMSTTLAIGMKYCWCGLYNICFTSDPRLTLIYFTTRSNVFLNVFIWGETLKRWLFNCWSQSHTTYLIYSTYWFNGLS